MLSNQAPQLGHARTTIGAGLELGADGARILTTVRDRGFDRVAANTEASAHGRATVGCGIGGTRRQETGALAFRQARLLE